MSLFQLGKFTSHSGKELDWKIECDALTDDDWKCLAKLIADRVGIFGQVYGIPRGGEKLAEFLRPYRVPEAPTRLVVDDVWTTGESMMKELKEDDIGYVIFGRGYIPQDVSVEVMFWTNE